MPLNTSQEKKTIIPRKDWIPEKGASNSSILGKSELLAACSIVAVNSIWAPCGKAARQAASSICSSWSAATICQVSKQFRMGPCEQVQPQFLKAINNQITSFQPSVPWCTMAHHCKHFTRNFKKIKTWVLNADSGRLFHASPHSRPHWSHRAHLPKIPSVRFFRCPKMDPSTATVEVRHPCLFLGCSKSRQKISSVFHGLWGRHEGWKPNDRAMPTESWHSKIKGSFYGDEDGFSARSFHISLFWQCGVFFLVVPSKQLSG